MNVRLKNKINIKELQCIKTLTLISGKIKYYSLKELKKKGFNIDAMPFSIRILLENVIRNYNGFSVRDENLESILNWKPKPLDKEIPYLPARVLMQDFTGVPSVVDIASIRSEVKRKNKNTDKINPQILVDLIIDHSVQVDYFGTTYALKKNVEMEYHRNKERYSLLKWADSSFKILKFFHRGWEFATR